MPRVTDRAVSCTITGCTKPRVAGSGWCETHRKQFQTLGSAVHRAKPGWQCAAAGCTAQRSDGEYCAAHAAAFVERSRIQVEPTGAPAPAYLESLAKPTDDAGALTTLPPTITFPPMETCASYLVPVQFLEAMAAIERDAIEAIMAMVHIIAGEPVTPALNLATYSPN